jgi:molybdopterin synthase sulfur carrier subunit
MKITLRTFADFREVIGTAEMELFPPEGESVRGVLKGLCETHPALRGKIFDAAGNLKPYILVLKNGRNVASLQQLDTLLADRDVIALFPPVAGG